MCFTEHNNLIYIGTKRGGLNSYNHSTEEITQLIIENTPSIQIRDIEIFNNKLYAATSIGGIHFLKNDKWLHFLDSTHIQIIKPTTKELWLGGLNGELFFKKLDKTELIEIDIIKYSKTGIWGINLDNAENLWLGTFGGGLLKMNAKSKKVTHQFVTQKENVNSLSHDVILTLFTDKDGGVWVGTLGGGVNYFDPNNQKFKHYNSINGLSNNVVMSFLEENNKLYIGTYGGGLNILDFNTNQFSTIKTVQAKIIRCIYKDNSGVIWLGTHGNGLLKYNPKNNSVKQVLKNITDDVWSIIEGDSNELWIGTWGAGLINYNKKNNEFIQFLKTDSKNSINENIILSLGKNSKNDLWIGTYGSGLSYFNVITNKFNPYGFEGKNKQQTNNKKIRSIYVDENDDLWIGTDGGGINHFNSKKSEFNYITTDDKLPNNVVYDIVKIKNNIWVSTNYGIGRYSIENKTITSFDYDDGLQNNEFNQGALYHNAETIYAGGINGFNIFNPQEIEIETKKTNTIITSLKVMGNEYKTPISYTDTINLHYSSNFLGFQFSHLDYSGKIIYRCKLEGFDKEWVQLNERNFINYTNLPAGEYSLKFQGKRSGNWDNNFSTLFITIPPPFWKTIWFYILAAILILLLLYSFYILKQKNLLRKNVELENQVKKRTQEIEQKNKSLEEQKREVETQKELAEAKHNEIQASISYAKRIQSAILPPLKVFKSHLPNSFILYKPKAIVAGDFYWLEQQGGRTLFAAADCTGHGVPGAMVSVVCNNALNRSVREYQLTTPGEILNKSREIVIEEFEKADEDVKDGMDIALCSIEGNKLLYAGAHNPLWIIRNGVVLETKANKQPIGQFRRSDPFTTHAFDLQKGDTIYLFSDGYKDQFGGEKGKKFKTKGFRELLISVQNKTMEEQKTFINDVFEKWKGDLEQIDDVCIIGVRI
ncbi:MAG: two-component regulator propeller domain-containing protein [Vicingaceae bacterium]|nr:two-component regulator propeller domain-containing protein [Vicingaceae bacterium]